MYGGTLATWHAGLWRAACLSSKAAGRVTSPLTVWCGAYCPVRADRAITVSRSKTARRERELLPLIAVPQKLGAYV